MASIFLGLNELNDGLAPISAKPVPEEVLPWWQLDWKNWKNFSQIKIERLPLQAFLSRPQCVDGEAWHICFIEQDQIYFRLLAYLLLDAKPFPKLSRTECYL